MSEQILLLNPRRLRNRKRPSRRRKHNRRMSALQRKYFGKRRHNRHRRRRSTMGATYRKRSHNRKRSRRYNRMRMRTRRHNRRTLPSLNISGRGILRDFVIPGAIGAAGAVGLDWAWGKVAPHLTFIPVSMQSGWGSTAVRVGFAVLATALAAKFAPPKLKRPLLVAGAGAVTITLGTAFKGAAISAGVPLSGYVDYQSYALPGASMGAYMPLGAYQQRQNLGDLYSPAAVIQPAGVAVPRQFGNYVAWQPHMGGNSGLMDYNWQADGM